MRSEHRRVFPQMRSARGTGAPRRLERLAEMRLLLPVCREKLLSQGILVLALGRLVLKALGLQVKE